MTNKEIEQFDRLRMIDDLVAKLAYEEPDYMDYCFGLPYAEHHNIKFDTWEHGVEIINEYVNYAVEASLDRKDVEEFKDGRFKYHRHWAYAQDDWAYR